MGMMKLAVTGAAAMIACALVGCDQGEPMTAGETAAWMPADASIPERPDATYEEDASGGEPGRVCFEPMPLAPAALPRCTASTRDCVDACVEGPEGEECRNGCWGSDETPRYTEGGANVGCNECIFTQLIACLDRDGCDDEVAAFYCCLVDRCSAGGDGCLQTECGTELNAMFSCGAARARHCFALTDGDIGQCYAESDPPIGDDAGTDAAADASADAGVDGGGA